MDKLSSKQPEGTSELSQYTNAVLESVLFEGENLDNYIPEIKRRVFKAGKDWAEYERNLQRLIELYNVCKGTQKFNKPNLLELESLCNSLSVSSSIINKENWQANEAKVTQAEKENIKPDIVAKESKVNDDEYFLETKRKEEIEKNKEKEDKSKNLELFKEKINGIAFKLVRTGSLPSDKILEMADKCGVDGYEICDLLQKIFDIHLEISEKGYITGEDKSQIHRLGQAAYLTKETRNNILNKIQQQLDLNNNESNLLETNENSSVYNLNSESNFINHPVNLKASYQAEYNRLKEQGITPHECPHCGFPVKSVDQNDKIVLLIGLIGLLIGFFAGYKITVWGGYSWWIGIIIGIIIGYLAFLLILIEFYTELLNCPNCKKKYSKAKIYDE